MTLFEELKRRNVIRVGTLYMVAGWLVLQVADLMFDVMGLPEWSLRLVFGILLLGLPLALVFSWIFEVTPDGIVRDDGSAAQRADTHTIKKLDVTIAVLLACAIGLIAWDRISPSGSRDDQADSVAQPSAPGTASVDDAEMPSIAVMPFENFSGDPAQEYFSDGLSDTVLHQLAQVQGLRVIARNSTFQFKGSNLDVREIGQRLKVGHVLEGSVQRAGDKVRVIAQLVRTDDGGHVWSQSFDHTMDDIFALQDAVAAGVVKQLKIALTPEQKAQTRLGATDVAEAYDLLLRAEQEVKTTLSQSMSDQIDPDAFEPMQRIDRALDLDPEYVDALIAKVLVYNQFAFLTSSMVRSQEYMARSRQYVDRALALQPQYSGAWHAQGTWAHRTGQSDLARQSYRRAIELNPNNASAHQGLAVASIYDDPLATLEHMRIVRQLDPSSDFERPTIMALTRLNRLDEAQAKLEAVIRDTVPTSTSYEIALADLSSLMLSARGRPDLSARWAAKLRALQPESSEAAHRMGEAWLAVGDFDRAKQWASVSGTEGDESITSLQSRVLIAQGEHEAALAAILRLPESSLSIRAVRASAAFVQAMLLGDVLQAQTHLTQRMQAHEDARKQGRQSNYWEAHLKLMRATLADAMGEDASGDAEEAIRLTRPMLRSGWAGAEAARYLDVEAMILLGRTEMALATLNETLIENEGFLADDTFRVPAERGYLLRRLEQQPAFQAWRTEFLRRRDVARQRLLSMEASGEIPAPPA